MNGFSVNTDILNSVKKKSRKTVKKYKRFMVPAVAVALTVVVVLLFLALVPLRTVKELESCIATDTQGNKTITYYNKDGKEETSESYYRDELNTVNKYFYNKDGSIAKMESYYVDQLVSTENYVYDKGLLTEKSIVGTDGTVYGKTMYTYVEGLLELSVDCNEEGEPTTEIKYNYDKKVLTSTTSVTIANGYTITTEFTYDKGNVVKETITANSGVTKEIRYTYDRFGNMLSKTEGVEDYTLYNYTYKTKKVTVFY